MTMRTMMQPADLLTRLEDDATALATRDTLTPDDLCLLLTQLDSVLKRAREAKQAVENFLIDWLPAHGGELVIGEERKYVGDKTKEKCRNIPDVVTAIFKAVEGDYEKFCDCLSANAIKHGAAKKVLGEKYRDHFETITELDILTDKPRKVLKSLNENFLR